MHNKPYTVNYKKFQWNVASGCIKRIYAGMLPDFKKLRLLMSLKVFIDDSGDEESFVLGGLIAPVEVWDKFSVDWVNVCKEVPSIEYYRTNEAIGLKKCFQRIDPDSRNKKVARLASIIPIENCCIMSVYLSRPGFEQLKNRYSINAHFPYNYPYYDPYFISASCLIAWACVQSTSLFPTIVKKGGGIDFVFDEQGKLEKKFQAFFDQWIKNSLLHPSPKYCFYLNDKDSPAIQVADMIASWVRRGATSKRVQIWTPADIYLSNIERRSLEINRDTFGEFAAKLKYRVT